MNSPFQIQRKNLVIPWTGWSMCSAVCKGVQDREQKELTAVLFDTNWLCISGLGIISESWGIWILCFPNMWIVQQLSEIRQLLCRKISNSVYGVTYVHRKLIFGKMVPGHQVLEAWLKRSTFVKPVLEPVWSTAWLLCSALLRQYYKLSLSLRLDTKMAGIFNCVAQSQEDILQKTVPLFCVLPCLKEDDAVTRWMIDINICFRCLLPGVHLGFNLLPFGDSQE